MTKITISKREVTKIGGKPVRITVCASCVMGGLTYEFAVDLIDIKGKTETEIRQVAKKKIRDHIKYLKTKKEVTHNGDTEWNETYDEDV